MCLQQHVPAQIEAKASSCWCTAVAVHSTCSVYDGAVVTLRCGEKPAQAGEAAGKAEAVALNAAQLARAAHTKAALAAAISASQAYNQVTPSHQPLWTPCSFPFHAPIIRSTCNCRLQSVCRCLLLVFSVRRPPRVNDASSSSDDAKTW